MCCGSCGRSRGHAPSLTCTHCQTCRRTAQFIRAEQQHLSSIPDCLQEPTRFDTPRRNVLAVRVVIPVALPGEIFLSNCKLFPPSSNTFDTNSFLFFFLPPLRDLLPGPFLVPQLQPCLPAVPVFLQRFPSHPVPESSGSRVIRFPSHPVPESSGSRVIRFPSHPVPVSAPEFVPELFNPTSQHPPPDPVTRTLPFDFDFSHLSQLYFSPSRFREVFIFFFFPPLFSSRIFPRFD